MCGFVLSWFIKELPLRETVTTGDLGDTFATPRDTDSLSVAISKIGRMERRESAREIVRRVAGRAGVYLQPASCWLLARLSEDAPCEIAALAERSGIDPGTLVDARAELLDRALIAPADAGCFDLTQEGHRTLDLLDSYRGRAAVRAARGMATAGTRGACAGDRADRSRFLHRHVDTRRAPRLAVSRRMRDGRRRRPACNPSLTTKRVCDVPKTSVSDVPSITEKRMKGFEPSTFAMAKPERIAEARRYGRSDGL